MQQRGLVGGDADHRLLELHLDQPALGAELDDVALDLDRHAGHELGALEDGEDVVERDAALELERGQAGGDLVEAGAVLVEGRERLVGLGEDRGDLLEDVLGAVDVEGDDLAPLGDGDHERVGLLGHALGRAVAGARLGREDRRVRHQLDVGPGDLGRRGVERDRAVHLRELVEQLRRVIDVELDAARRRGTRARRGRRSRSGHPCERGRCCRCPRVLQSPARPSRATSQAGAPAALRAR